MLTFTKGGAGTYSKLRIINEIKSYVTYLIANSKAEIYFFSNIEIGSKLDNPHLHTQIWSDDKKAVRAIYDKIIAKFYLDSKRCKFSKPQQPHKYYNYLIKEYASDLTDKQVWDLETTKRDMRRTLGLKVRFISKSKGKYTSKLYRLVYHVFGVLRALADDFLDFFTNVLFIGKKKIEAIIGKKRDVLVKSKSSFISIKNKEVVMLPTLMSETYSIEILFFSPANDPPCEVRVRVFMVWVLDMTISFTL